MSQIVGVFFLHEKILRNFGVPPPLLGKVRHFKAQGLEMMFLHKIRFKFTEKG